MQANCRCDKSEKCTKHKLIDMLQCAFDEMLARYNCLTNIEFGLYLMSLCQEIKQPDICNLIHEDPQSSFDDLEDLCQKIEDLDDD